MKESDSYGSCDPLGNTVAQYKVQPNKSSRLVLSVFSFLALLTFVIAINENFNGSVGKIISWGKISTLRQDTSNSNGDSENDFPSWTLYREGYSPLSYFTSDASSFLKYKFLDGNDAVIEPSAFMYLYVDGYDTSSGSDDASSSHYKFEVCTEGVDMQCVKGTLHRDTSTPIKIACEPFQLFNISVKEISSDGDMLGYDFGIATCMYVRREIRSLTESHLNDTMNAMATLWYTSEEEGREKYGENFHNSTYIASAHYFGAGQQDADHIHEGLGFLLQHIKLTNIFELSIQAVDPSVSLPYWDFTIDTAEKIDTYDIPIFQENMFGSLVKPKGSGWDYSSNSIDDAKIPDGRWANLKSEKNIWYSTMRNGYGYLRAPWNMNPSPYITRFISAHDFPGCSSYKSWLEKSSLMMFLKYAPGPPHAATHGNIGGSFGCDYLDWMTEAGYLTSSRQSALCSKVIVRWPMLIVLGLFDLFSLAMLKPQWGFKMKDLYRLNFIEPSKDCVQADDINDSVCGFKCVTSMQGGMISAMNDSMAMYFGTDFSTKHWTAIRDFICEGNGYKVFFGDHLESASAADPSFWPIHPTMERTFQVKFLAGGFKDTTWYNDYINEWICGRNECYEPDVGPDKEYNERCCRGHYRDDGIIDFVSGNKSNYIGLTNKEVVEYTDPTSEDYGMPYIYDSFSWSHCSQDDFDGFLEELNSGTASLSDDDDSTFDATDPLSTSR